MSIFILILGLLMFVGLVVIHELGHFVVARRGGVKVEEFGLGFPPRAKILTKKKGTIYSLNWLPLGGFVRLKGEHDGDTQPGTFGAASLGTKVKIMIAGVAMNLGAAFVLLTILAIVGMPQLIDQQFTVKSDTKVIKNEVLVGYVEPGSPAIQAGLMPRDQLESISSPGKSIITIQSAQQLPQITKQLAGKMITIAYKRGGGQHVITTTLRSEQTVAASLKSNNAKGYLGVSPTEYTLQRSTWSAPVVAAELIKQFTVLTFKGLGSAIAGLARGNTKQASANVSGPVGIFVLLKDGSALGYQFILMIVAIISLTLAIMNVLPIPALDGGKLFVLLLFRALHRPLKESTEDWIHGTGFALLMVLVVLITIVDVKRIH